MLFIRGNQTPHIYELERVVGIILPFRFSGPMGLFRGCRERDYTDPTDHVDSVITLDIPHRGRPAHRWLLHMTKKIFRRNVRYTDTQEQGFICLRLEVDIRRTNKEGTCTSVFDPCRPTSPTGPDESSRPIHLPSRVPVGLYTQYLDVPSRVRIFRHWTSRRSMMSSSIRFLPVRGDQESRTSEPRSQTAHDITSQTGYECTSV